MNFDITWIIAIISITGSFFNIGKKAICFYFWIVCEIICFIIDIQNGQYGRAFLDLFCIGMNIYGIFSWSKSDKAQKKNGVEENEGFGITNKELNDNIFYKEYNNFERIIIKTHFVNIGESYINLVNTYVLPHFEKGDILFISEKIISMCQKNIVEKKDVKLGFFAKFLSKFASSNSSGIGMDEPYKLQLAIDLAGLHLVLFACLCSALTKIFGKKGVFYQIVGHGISEIDGFYAHSAFELYHDIAILSPINPEKVCDEIYENCGIKSVIIDANDIGAKVLGKTHNLEKEDAELISMIKDNPAGQDDQLTPFILIKNVI